MKQVQILIKIKSDILDLREKTIEIKNQRFIISVSQMVIAVGDSSSHSN